MRLMRARMTRGTAVVMGVTSRSVRSVASHRRRAAASGSRTTARNSSCQARVFAAPPGRWPTQNGWIWPSIMANQPLAMPAQTRRSGFSQDAELQREELLQENGDAA